MLPPEEIEKRKAAAKTFIGKIFEFSLDGTERGVRVRGKCIGAEYTGRHPSNGIPDYSLTLRGRTGKTLTISMTFNYAFALKTWNSND